MIEHHTVWWKTIALLWKANDWKIPDVIYLKQVHGINCVYEPKELWIQGDAILARYWSWPYAVKITDCLWVCILGKERYTLVHVWRRGLYQWLLHSVVQNLYRQWEQQVDMHAFLSPCLRKLEVWKDWTDFKAITPEAYLKSKQNGLKEIDTIARALSQLVY